MSEYKIINNNKNLIVCFGGHALKFGGFLPFEFLNYLSANYINNSDLIFYIDKNQCSYHKGIENISNNIDETVIYLNNQIANYNNIVFLGTSAGGYAAILFGSLCNNVKNVISFIPQTIIKDPIDIKYSNLKNIINNTTQYKLYGDKSIKNINDLHHILHCENIENYSNVQVYKLKNINLKKLRDEGILKKIIDNVIY